MKFSCSRKKLSDTLRIISRAVASKTDTQILSGIYIETKTDSLCLQTTDNRIGFSFHIPAEIEENGKIVILAKYFIEIVNNLPDDTVDFTYNDETKTAKITSGNANFALLTMNPDDFPVIKPIEDGTNFEINSEIMLQLIRKTSFACATEEAHPLFTGCNLEVNNDTLIMAATNTHRLAIKKAKIDSQPNKIKITIPAKFLNDFTQIASAEKPQKIIINCTESKIGFSFDENYMFCGIIKGDYPNYNKAIPANFSTVVLIDTKEFCSALERVSLISRTNKFNIVKMNFGENKVTMSSKNPEIGTVEETVPLQMLEGEGLNIAFNTQFMIDILKIVDSEKINISLSTNLKPISIRETDDESFTYISTPVRTMD